MVVAKSKIYDLINYLDILWKHREECSINIERISSLNGLKHEDLKVFQLDLSELSLIVDKDSMYSLTSIEQLKKWCMYHALNRYKIDRVHRIIRPVGSCKKPTYSDSGYLISQFRWDDNGSARSKNFPPPLHDSVSLAVSRGDTVNQVIRLIENSGDRPLALGHSANWVLPWEQELVEMGLID